MFRLIKVSIKHIFKVSNTQLLFLLVAKVNHKGLINVRLCKFSDGFKLASINL